MCDLERAMDVIASIVASRVTRHASSNSRQPRRYYNLHLSSLYLGSRPFPTSITGRHSTV